MINRCRIGFILLAVLVLSSFVGAAEGENAPSLSKADYGMSFVTWYGGGSFSIAYGVTIYVDPVAMPDGLPKADAILITHPHAENLSLEAINQLLGGYTQIYGPEEAILKISEGGVKVSAEQLHVVKPFEDIVTGSYTFSTVPAYNTTTELHPQTSGWVGYILSIFTPRGEARLYFAGDTSKIVEMENLKGKVDVAYLSIDSEHGMATLAEAVDAAVTLGVEIAVPVRYKSSAEADQFVGMLSGVDGIDGIIMDEK